MDLRSIFIVAGHSEVDPGAISADRTVSERDVVTGICYKLMDKLPAGRAFDIGLDVSMTLSQKIEQINKYCDDFGLDHNNSALVSIHCDWNKADDNVSGYYYDGNSPSQQLCENLVENLASDTDRPVGFVLGDTKSRFNRLGVIRDTKPLASLIEVGSLKKYGTMYRGVDLLSDTEGQDRIADSIASTIYNMTGWDREGLSDSTRDELLSDCTDMWHTLDENRKQTTKCIKQVEQMAQYIRSIN